MADAPIADTFERALQLHMAGRLDQAESLYRQVLSQSPDDPEAVGQLGLVALQKGNSRSAIQLIRHALSLDPDWPEAHHNLAMALEREGNNKEAVDEYRKALELDPSLVQTHVRLAGLFQSMGRMKDALTSFQAAAKLEPNSAELHSTIGVMLRKQGDLEGAVVALRRAIALEPAGFQYFNNLGNCLWNQQKLDEATAAFERALALNPRFTPAYTNLAALCTERRQFDRAIECGQRAVALEPGRPEAHYGLANALKGKRRIAESIAAYRQAIAVKPDYFEALGSLADLLVRVEEFDEAVELYQRAMQLGDATIPMGNALCFMGQVREAVECFRKPAIGQPDPSALHSNLLLALNYLPDVTPAEITQESREWASKYARPEEKKMVRCFRKIDPDRRLRIGYVSPDFRSHAVCSFSMPLISSHNRQEFEIYLYANVEDPDAITQEFRQQADAWRDIFGMPNDQAAQLIRDDQIDILIDLAGHTSGNRLLVFAQKPAPIQVTYLGYPATTGMETIDYRLTDAHADPPGLTDAFCTEKLVRLPQTTWCFKARLRSSDVSPLPAISNGYVTFGSFNNFSKTNEPLYDLWAKVLHAVPNSRLLFKARPFSSQAVLSRVAARFDQLGVARDRVDLRRWVPLPDHLAAYNSVDIALDSFPYHGTTTTCEAMWMGVPTITLAGDSHLSRVGLSLMTNAGLGQFVAQNKREYVEIAANLAKDIPKLAALRARLRSQMSASPLMDKAAFARNVESAYRQMWRAWCEAETV